MRHMTEPAVARYTSLRGHVRDAEGRTNDVTLVRAYRL